VRATGDWRPASDLDRQTSEETTRRRTRRRTRKWHRRRLAATDGHNSRPR
jgi:hypothetical protein